MPVPAGATTGNVVVAVGGADSNGINFTVIVPGTVQLITTATLSKLSGGYQALVTITNKGTGTAQNVTLTAATLGAATGTPIPISLGNIAPTSGSVVTTVIFSSSTGGSGAAAAERYSCIYTGGTFGGSIRATLP